MKKAKKLLLSGLSACCAALAVSCSQDLDRPEGMDTQRGNPIEIFSEIQQTYRTRVNDGGFCDADRMGIYVVDYNGTTPGTLQSSGNRGDNVRYTYEEATGKWIASEALYFKDQQTPVDIYGYYPYASPENTGAHAFTVAKDQSTLTGERGMGGYEASDFLWGKTENVAPSVERALVTLRHRMACVRITLAEGSGFEEGEWGKLEKALLVTNTRRDALINLATGEVSVTGDLPATGIIPAHTGDTWRAIVVPQDIAASTPLFSITVDGIPYTFRKEEAFTFFPQKMHTFTVSISKKSGGGLEFTVQSEGIAAWEADEFSHDAEGKEYVVINVTEAGKLKEAIVQSGKDVTLVKNLKITGTINANDFFFMRDTMTGLQCLNLQEVGIAECKREYYPPYAANEIPEKALYRKQTLTRLTLPDKITKINKNAFAQTNITGSIIIPEGVTEIGESAFSDCKNLSGTLTLPTTLEKIGYGAFNHCSGLVGILAIPQKVVYIGEYAFYDCSGFSGSLVLPEELEFLGYDSFNACSGFTGSLVIPDKIKVIPMRAFCNCQGLNGQLRFAQDVTEIKAQAFFNCQFRGELRLPETLTTIGASAFYSNLFSGQLILPASLTIIEGDVWGVFSNCSRLSGTVTLPEGLTSVPENLFNSCSQLEGIVLPSTMEQIKEGVFTNCYQINSFICNAKEPPYIRGDALDGIPKDNFILQVPEQSVSLYQTAPGWREFKRISAYRDFSVNRKLIRALNAPFSQTLNLRTENSAAWEVESKPDWITVTPASGTGKAELTVTFSELPQGSPMRTGEIKFLLRDKDYRLTTTVEQYDYEQGDGDVVTQQTATQGNGVNIVFIGDGFDAKEIAAGTYKQAMEQACSHFFAVEPYRTYQAYFNAYTVYAHAPESGIETVNTIRENKFRTRSRGGNKLDADFDAIFRYACKAPINDRTDRTLIVFIPNTFEYGGVTRMWGDGSAISICPMSTDEYPYDFRGLVQHEAGGHGFGKLGDEYIYVNGYADFCGCSNEHADALRTGQSRGWYQNLSLTNNYAKLPWSEFIFHPKYANIVDVYEGGWFHTRKVWRSEPNSCMNNNIPYFSAVSRREIVKRIMEYSGGSFDFDAFVAKDVTDASTPTKTAGQWGKLPLYAPPANQNPPVYMGDKPTFRK